MFKSKKAAEPVDLPTAIGRLSADPSGANRKALNEALADCYLFLAAQTVPSAWANGPIKLEEATTVSALTSSAPDGGEALLAFTSTDEVKKRNAVAASFSMRSLDVLNLVIGQGFSALVLNPGGRWAAVPRADIEKILQDARQEP